MGNRFAEIAFTPAVQAQQEANGTRASYARFAEGLAWNDRIGEKEDEFIRARDGFYLASVSETVDYANRRRLKILGRTELLEVGADAGLAAQLAVPGYKAVVERAVRIRVEGFYWNCPQHITPRFTIDEIERATQPLRDRVATLEAQLASCEERLR